MIVSTSRSLATSLSKNLFHHHSSTLATGYAASSTALHAGSVYRDAALGFLGGLRLPASLLAGSSVAALFSLVDKARSIEKLNPTERTTIRFYHAASFYTLLASLVTIIATTVGSTLLLLGKHDQGSDYTDVYHFLRGNLDVDFILARFAFTTSLISFLVSITARILLEFGLLETNSPKRRVAGFVVSLMVAMITSVLSHINQTLNCWPDIISMSRDVFLLLVRATMKQKTPLQLVGCGATLVAAWNGFMYLWEAWKRSKNRSPEA